MKLARVAKKGNRSFYVEFMMMTLVPLIICSIIMMIVCRFLDRFRENPLVEGAFTGIRPVTIGLLGAAVIFVSEGVLVHGPLISRALVTAGLDYYNLIAIGIAAVTVLLMTALKMKPVRVMLLMAAVGAVCGGMGLF